MTVGADGVAIYGMARSGTSAVTGLFAASGFYVGADEDLLPASEGNPGGYYENRNTLALNNEVLAELGGSWFDPPSEERMASESARYRPRLQAVFEALLRAAGDAPLAVKDPRLQVMMPLWDPVIGDRLHPVVVVRDPVEIAQSLARRDGSPMAFSLAAWELSMTRLLRALRGRTVTVAHYAVVLGSGEAAQGVVSEAAEWLAPWRLRRVHPSDGKGWLRSDLHRNYASDADHESLMTLTQERLWRWLSDLPSGKHTLDPREELLVELPAASEAVGYETARLCAAAGLNAQERELAALRVKLEAALAKRDEARVQAERAQGQAEKDRAECSRAEAARADAQATLDVIVRSRSWRLTSVARRAAAELRRRRPKG